MQLQGACALVLECALLTAIPGQLASQQGSAPGGGGAPPGSRLCTDPMPVCRPNLQVRRVRCETSAAMVPKDKAIKRFLVRGAAGVSLSFAIACALSVLFQQVVLPPVTAASNAAIAALDAAPLGALLQLPCNVQWLAHRPGGIDLSVRWPAGARWA